MKLIHGDCLEEMDKLIEQGVKVDLTVTSPPYDNLRTYNGTCNWNESIWKQVIEKLYVITKDGGVVVWIVNDCKTNGNKSLTSFKQALYFQSVGFFAHDVMVWQKNGFSSPIKNMYHNCFEYMFIFSKGKPKTFNPIMDRKNKKAGTRTISTFRAPDGSISKRTAKTIGDFGKRFNVWQINSVKNNAHGKHPAPFPEQLANDHIISWSNEKDIVFDPFMGSGTTGKMAKLAGRDFIGIEKVEEYFEIAKNRIENTTSLFGVANEH